MKYGESLKLLDLDRDLPTGETDIQVLRKLRRAPLPDLRAYLEFLARFPAASASALRSRKGPAGPEPFELRQFSFSDD